MRAILPALLLVLLIPQARAAFESVGPGIFRWKSTCNSYVIRFGQKGVVIDPGDGSVLDHLPELNISGPVRVLLSSHHRELHQGLGTGGEGNFSVAAPRDEKDFFEFPNRFRKWVPRLSDPFTVHGSSFLRPPAAPRSAERWLADGENIADGLPGLRAVSTPGHSPGGLSFLLERAGGTYAFIGGLAHDGARMSNWFDSEWDYGFAKGIDVLAASAQKLADLGPHTAFPAQGPLMKNAAQQFQQLAGRLKEFRVDYVRGYPVESLSNRGLHPATKPTRAGPIVQVSPHLYMLGPQMAGKNFTILIADSGHALLLDCGLFSRVVLERLIADMKEHLGLKKIDACWISHSHGDHFTLFPALSEHGVRFWTMDLIADKCENPRFYDYPAMIGAYNAGFEKAKIDRVLKAGETIDWEGYKLHVDWMPGQTEFGNALWLEVDGKKVVFTGDNIFGDPADATQTGHECVNARNSAILEEGYLAAARYLEQLAPDLIVGAHGVLMTEPTAFIQRYKAWAEKMIGLYRGMLPDPDYEYGFDPYWVRAYPFRVDLREQDSAVVEVTVRNFRRAPQEHRIALRMPPGVEAEPAVLTGRVAPLSRETFRVKLSVRDRSQLPGGVRMVPFDITLDHRRYGELFDFVLLGRNEPQGETPAR